MNSPKSSASPDKMKCAPVTRSRTCYIKQFAMMALLAGLPPVSADDHHAAMEERAGKVKEASLVQARPKTQNIAFPWLALWHLRRGENEEGLRILYELLDCTPPANQGHPFLSYGLAHLWLHYGHLYDEVHRQKWKELVRARSSYSYNLDPFPNNYSTTNLRMTGSVTWYLSNIGLKPNELPPGYAPADDPDRSKYLRRSIHRIARSGMPEFGSRPYGGLNALPLLCLADQTADKDLARKAAVVYEAYLATVAPTWLQGHWATATQRSYTDTINQSTRGGINFLWTYFGGLPNDGSTNGMAGAAMGYRPPGYLAEIANRRNRPYEALIRASWNKDDDPDIRIEPTGFLQTTWMEPTYAVYAQMTAPRTRLQELQIYGNGVMWVDPEPKVTSCLWVTVPTGGTGHTHGSPELGAEYVHHERSLLLVAKPEDGEAFPWIKGNVPANRLAMIDDSAKDGRIYLAYHGVLIAITAPSPFNWNPEDPIQLDHVTKPKVRKPGDTAPVDGFYRITSGPLAVAIDTMPPTDAKGATPEERLAWFREQVRAKTRLTATDGSAEYRNLGGAVLQRKIGGPAVVNGRAVDVEEKPFLSNPWMSQPYQQDPEQPCTLTVSIDGRTHLYDLKDFTITHHDGPARPVGLTAKPGAGRVTLEWTAGPGEPEIHVIYRAEGDGPFKVIETTTATQWQDTKVKDGKDYRWQVAARNRGGESPPCLPVSATPGPGRPATPAGLAITGTNSRIDLAWGPVEGATGYRVWRASSPDHEPVLLATVEKPAHRDESLKNGTSWWYAVEAVSATGIGGRSKAVRSMARPPLLAAPEGLTWERGEKVIGGVAKPGVTIRWKPVPGAARYNVRVANIKRGLYINRGAVRDDTTWFLTDELARGVAWIRVTAVNAAGEGEPTQPALMPVEPVKKPD